MVVASEGAAEALIKAGEESDRLLSPSTDHTGRPPNHTVTYTDQLRIVLYFLPFPACLSGPAGPSRRLV